MDLEKLWQWGREKMDAHGLTDCELVYSGTTGRTLGSWHCGTRRITVSAVHAFRASEAEAKDTILHEIAHALAGSDAKHGPRWKAVARSIGAKPNRVSDEVTTDISDYRVIGTCPQGHFFHRTSMPRQTGWSCNKGCETHLAWSDRRITWKYNPQADVPAEVVAAVKAHGPRKVAAAVRVGARVKLKVPGTDWDGRVGTVQSVARVNYIVKVDNRPRAVRLPFQAVEPLS